MKLILDADKTTEQLFISNGDTFFGNLDLQSYYDFYSSGNADFAFCLKFVMTPEQLGNVVIQGDKIIDFVEKPQAKATYLTNSGLYITTKSFMTRTDIGSHLETDFFPYIVENSRVLGYIYSGEWEHIQNDSAFERVNGELI